MFTTGMRDWSLITGRGAGGTKREREGQVKFHPYKKGVGGEKRFNHAEVGHNKFWGSFHMGA